MFEGKWNILVVIDKTEESVKAADCAIDLALTGLDTTMYLVYSSEVEPLSDPPERGEDLVHGIMRTKADEKIFTISDKLKTHGIDYRFLSYNFGTSDGIIDKVENELEIDMIIIGVEKPSLLSKIFGGQHTGKAIYGSRAPVLMVKHGYVSKVKSMIEAGLIEPIKVIPKESGKAMEGTRESATT